jgi:Tol biopolymer transport system component
MSADGSTTPQIVYAGRTDLAVEAHPSWSPDGTKLVFQEGNVSVVMSTAGVEPSAGTT